MCSAWRTVTPASNARESDARAALFGRFPLAFLCGLSLIGSPPPAAGQVGLTGGTEYGFGVVGRVGISPVLLEVGGGITPVLVLGTQQVQFNGVVVSDEVFFEAFFPAAIGAKLSLRIGGSDDGVTRTALEFGATYNSLLRLGVGGGFDARVSERVVLSAGLMYYSEGGERLGEEVSEARGLPPNLLDLGPLVQFRPYVGLSLLLF